DLEVLIKTQELFRDAALVRCNLLKAASDSSLDRKCSKVAMEVGESIENEVKQAKACAPFDLAKLEVLEKCFQFLKSLSPFKLSSPVASEADACEHKDKEEEVLKDGEEKDCEPSEAIDAKLGKFSWDGNTASTVASEITQVKEVSKLMAFEVELAKGNSVSDKDDTSDEKTFGDDEMGSEQGMDDLSVSFSVPKFDPKLSSSQSPPVNLVDDLDSGDKIGKGKLQLGDKGAPFGQAPQVFDDLPHQNSEPFYIGYVGDNVQPFKKLGVKSQNCAEGKTRDNVVASDPSLKEEHGVSRLNICSSSSKIELVDLGTACDSNIIDIEDTLVDSQTWATCLVGHFLDVDLANGLVRAITRSL
ncbi:hypothetical protein U1Q18_036392, partial [Sarracenia purpurea var. burkii]